MKEAEIFLSKIVPALDQAKIPFMVTGSIASGIHGKFRATQDIDIVVDPTLSQLRQFISLLPKEWYVSSEAAESALKHRSMFNVIDAAAAWKVDLIMRKNTPFEISEFGRRSLSNYEGVMITLITPEDSILSKLDWSKDSDSAQQREDAINVARRQRDQLDMVYLDRWAKELGIEAKLKDVLDVANATP